MTFGNSKYNRMSYDELAKIVNKKYETEKNMRKIALELNISFSEVWEMIGFKDFFDYAPIHVGGNKASNDNEEEK
tara:strand:+ start:247 stop:471 length:225 start_codon:yes stop_codon:yes gene_type:complete